MNTSGLARVAGGVLAAVLAAVAVRFFAFDMWSGAGGQSLGARLWSAIGYAVGYGLPPAAAAMALVEAVRLRSIAMHAGLGAAGALIAGYLATRGAPLSSPDYANGTLGALALLATGVSAGLAYWAAAGRRAGWRGDSAEQAEAQALEAFCAASAKAAPPERCVECIAGLAGVAALVFVLFSWVAIDGTGLRDWLRAETEATGNAMLESAGQTWARFRIDGSRGVIEGLAPDEVAKRASYDQLRDALHAVIGIPGVLAVIDNEAVARRPLAEVSEELAAARRRESQAKSEAEQARLAAEAARAAEADARRQAEEQSRAAAAEKERIERRVAEQARAIAQQQQAAARLAAVEPVEQVDPRVGVSRSAPSSPALEPGQASACTPQDLAVIETSRIVFPRQQFEFSDDFALTLDRLASSARACAPRPVQVTGYADLDDDSLFNRALGLQRAEAVRSALLDRGVPSALVIANSGGSAPVVSDVTGEERIWNRRTEFRLLEVSELSRDENLGPEERATTCENDLTEIMSNSIIHFKSGSAKVELSSLGLIRKLAAAIQTCGSVIVTLEGHTDKTGADQFNQILSEARATAVREALVLAGADPTRLASRGFSSSQPYDAADTAAAYAMNRRIEFRVSGKFSSSSTRGP